MPAAASGSILLLRKGHTCWATLYMKVYSRRVFGVFLFFFCQKREMSQLAQQGQMEEDWPPSLAPLKPEERGSEEQQPGDLLSFKNVPVITLHCSNQWHCWHWAWSGRTNDEKCPNFSADSRSSQWPLGLRVRGTQWVTGAVWDCTGFKDV